MKWRLVPVEPTEEMIDEGCGSDAYDIAIGENKKRHEDLMTKYPGVLKPRETHGAAPIQTLPIVWRAMLSAAPPPPEELVEEIARIICCPTECVTSHRSRCVAIKKNFWILGIARAIIAKLTAP